MSLYGHITREIKERMASFTEIVYENRITNVDAHRLAKRSVYETIGRHVWLLSAPDGVCTCYPNI